MLVHHDTWPLLLEMILSDSLATEWVADIPYENKKYNSSRGSSKKKREALRCIQRYSKYNKPKKEKVSLLNAIVLIYR